MVILGDVVATLGIFFQTECQIGKVDDVGHPWEPMLCVLPQLHTAILKDWRDGCSQNFEITLRGIHSTRIYTFSAI